MWRALNATQPVRDDRLAYRRFDEVAKRNMEPNLEPDVEAAWSAEIERRLVEIDAGTVELIPWDDFRSELFGEAECKE